MPAHPKCGSFLLRSALGIAALVLALGALAPAANAATIPVTSESPGLGGPNECTLAAAIQAANTDTAVNGCPAGSGADIITIPECNLVLTAAFFTDGTDGPIGMPAITSQITIQGLSSSLTFIRRDPGAPDFALFLVTSSGNLTLEFITLQEGKAPSGGGVINRGQLTVRFAVMSQHDATSTSAGGGAIANLGGTLTLENAQLFSNTSAGMGGGIFSTGTATITSSLFSSNSASMSGGGIFSAGGPLTITSSTVQFNNAQVSGGSIFTAPDSALTLTNSNVSFNFAGNSGAAVVGGGALALQGPASITNTTFSFNSTSDFSATMVFGGAIYSTGSSLGITRSSFFNNSAGPVATSYGGAILYDGPFGSPVTISNSTFGENNAGNGGGFAAMNGAIQFNNVTFSQNSADVGGAYHAMSTATFGLRNSILAGNTAETGPDCFVEAPGVITSLGHNIIGIACPGYMTGTGDQTGDTNTPLDPQIVRQFSNAFYTPIAGGPAVDMGDPAAPGTGGTSCEGVDQRNIARPVGPACDVGAIEGSVAVVDTAISMSSINGTVFQVGATIIYTLEVKNNGPQNATNVTLTHSLATGFVLQSAVSTQGTCSGTTFVSCAIGTLAPDATATVTITVTAPPTPVASAFASFIVSQSEFDPLTSNNSTFFSFRVARDGDIQMIKTASSQVAAGSNLSYFLSVRNHGTADATNVQIVDTLPAGVTPVLPLPAGCTDAMGTITCAIGTVGAGAIGSRTINVTTSTAGMITNTATAMATEPDPDTANNTAMATTNVRVATDIGVAKTDSPDPLVFSAGAQITYTVTVTNSGPADATNVVLSESLDFRTTLVSAMITQGSCTGTTFLTCNIGTMAPMTSVVLTVIVTVNEPCVARNTASVNMSELDTNFGNNFATAQTTVSGNPVTATADLSVTKTDSPDPVNVGDNLTYTVTVTNAGPDDAPAVNLMDVLPAGVSFVSAVSTQGTCSQASGVVSCAIGTVAADTSVTVTIVVTPNAGGVLTNTADVTSGATDPTPANNTATATTTVQGPDLTLTPPALVFPTTAIGATNSMNIILESTGNATLTITGIQITGINAADFSFPAVTLPLSLAPGAMQTVNILFAPTAAGNRSALFEVVSNAVSGSPITATLNGTAVVSGPIITLNPVAVNFGNVNVGATSPAMMITVSNTGDAAANISGITISGTNAADFAQTNNCPASLAAGSNCVANLTFTPGVLGIRNAQFNVASNAVGSPAIATLTGNGLDFVLTPPPGAPTSTTIVTGATATFPIQINNTGAPATFTLSCTSNAPATTCSVQPPTVVAGNGVPVLADVILNTTSCVWTAPYTGRRTLPPVDLRLLLAYTLLLMMLAMMVWRRVPQARRAHVLLVLLLVWTGLAAGCTGEAEQFGFGTVPGTYNITVSAVSGASTRTQVLTVTVTLPPGR